MLTIILIIGIIAAILTILIVLIQNPKGGGLASNFSAGNQLFGAKQTTEGVEKLTWVFITIILVVSLVASSYNVGSAKATKGGESATTEAQGPIDPAVEAAKSAKPKADANTKAPAAQAPSLEGNPNANPVGAPPAMPANPAPNTPAPQTR
jgi:preprotein translocase subunit SecG